MNSCNNETNFFDHAEPILSIPEAGSCSLLTGYERSNITANANIFQPCCSEAKPVGEERATCTCKLDSCDTCLAQHKEDFLLVAAVCNQESAAIPRLRIPRMAAALFVIGTLMLQASASIVPLDPRDHRDVPGNFLGEIQSHRIKRGESADVISNALSLLGETTIIDCLGNGATNADNAAAASDALIKDLGEGLTLPAHTCRNQDVSNSVAEVCNDGDVEYKVERDHLKAALDLMLEQCSSNGKSGKVTLDNKIRFNLYARAGMGRAGSASKKNKRGLVEKRCIGPDAVEVRGCAEDVCEPKIVVNESGDCPWTHQDDGDSCGQYCEVRATKYYGPAEEYENTRFCQGNSCYLEEGEGYSFEKSIGANFGLSGGGGSPIETVLSAGISFGFTWGKQEMTTQGVDFGGEGKCGFWMKAPTMLHSCGTFSEYQANFGELVLYCLKDAPFMATTQNACSDTIAKSITGDDEGDVVVIPRYHSCTDRTELPMEEQSQQWKDLYGGSLADLDC
ncbi:hypothetical protein NLU13_5145 [Sarocladium strictum]|uniref:Uncharacterized protein n=1 Tax=Sarocladium strictum TaxID=5046 RepID=A0AA39GIS6_SARSR|nr:hypothetical protein NLU13_5145 [Sarocladium strictum]